MSSFVDAMIISPEVMIFIFLTDKSKRCIEKVAGNAQEDLTVLSGPIIVVRLRQPDV